MLRVTLAVLLLVPAASAQLTAKQAVAQAKAASKAELKAFKAAGKAALAALDADLASTEATLSDASTVSFVASDVGNAAVAFVTSMNQAYAEALDSFLGSASDALDAFAGDQVLLGVYPKDFYVGTGGVLDDHRAAVLKAAGKVRAAAVKRLAKTAALADKKADLALTVVLRFPTAENAGSLNEDSVVLAQESGRLDMVLAASRTTELTDGMLYISGATDDSTQDAGVGYVRSGTVYDEVEVTPAGGRFVATFTSLPEGNYVVYELQAPAQPDSLGEIGLR